MPRRSNRLGVGILLLVALAAPVHAATVPHAMNLSWDACYGELGASANQSFACDTNAGTVNRLVVSFVLPVDVPQATGNEIVIDVISQSSPLPAWWEMRNVGDCRQASMALSVDSTGVGCQDWAAGQASGGIGSFVASVPSDPNVVDQHRSLKIAVAVPVTSVQHLTAGTQYFSCAILIDNRKTVGLGACGGCSVPVCLVFNHLKVTTTVAQDDVLFYTYGLAGQTQVTWQGAGANCNAVPVRNVTWGAVKSMYR